MYQISEQKLLAGWQLLYKLLTIRRDIDYAMVENIIYLIYNRGGYRRTTMDGRPSSYELLYICYKTEKEVGH